MVMKEGCEACPLKPGRMEDYNFKCGLSWQFCLDVIPQALEGVLTQERFDHGYIKWYEGRMARNGSCRNDDMQLREVTAVLLAVKTGYPNLEFVKFAERLITQTKNGE